jgi:hypothetical protein
MISDGTAQHTDVVLLERDAKIARRAPGRRIGLVDEKALLQLQVLAGARIAKTG